MNPPDFLDLEQIATSFGRAAAEYEKYAHLQQTIAANLLERVQQLNLKPQVIVDVGSGSGYVARHLAASYPTAQVYHLDIAFPMLKQAQRQIKPKFSFFTQSKQHFICSDAAHLPIATAQVDLVVSNLMLQWCNDIEQVVSEWARVLRPEGALLFTTFGLDTLQELRSCWAQVDTNSHLNHFFDMHELGNALFQTGLATPVMDTEWLTQHYATVKNLMQALKAIGAHNVTAMRPRGLTGKQKFAELIQHYESHRTAAGLPATYEVIYGYARGRKIEQQVKQQDGSVIIPITQINHK
jgi:malonyl-CoA O-methyltransferase